MLSAAGLAIVGLAGLAGSTGCAFSLPEPAKCDEPHLYYAPDPRSSDVYFGCEPPDGWLSNPPDEAMFEEDPDVDASDADPVPPGVIDHGAGEEDAEASVLERILRDTATVVYPGTGYTGDTALEAMDEPRGGPDTGDLPAEDTGDEGRGDSGDTGVGRDGDSGDTGDRPDDTGVPPRDTGEPVDGGVRDTGGNAQGGVGQGDTGGLPPQLIIAPNGDDVGDPPAPDPAETAKQLWIIVPADPRAAEPPAPTDPDAPQDVWIGPNGDPMAAPDGEAPGLRILIPAEPPPEPAPPP